MNPFTFQKLSYGVYVVSSLESGTNRGVGCIANSVMQVTSSPATIAISINHDNFTNKCIKESGVFALSILTQDCDPVLIGTFGFRSSKNTDKFSGVDSENIGGVPVLKQSCAYIICRVENEMESSSHTVFLGTVIDADVLSNAVPMTYSYYHEVVKGKSPKNAPTYIQQDENTKKQEDKKAVYKCAVCGYVYDGDIPFEDLPDDYKCPICSASKDKFVKVES